MLTTKRFNEITTILTKIDNNEFYLALYDLLLERAELKDKLEIAVHQIRTCTDYHPMLEYFNLRDQLILMKQSLPKLMD